MAVADRRARRRFPRWLFLAVLVTVVALVVNGVASTADGGPPARTTYLDSVRPSLQASAELGGDLTVLRDRGHELGPDAVRRTLEQLRDRSASLAAQVDRVPPPADWTEAQGFLLTTLVTRADAARLLDEALRSLQEQPVEDTVGKLTDVAQRLRVADRAYALFLERVPETVEPPLPASTWLTNPAAWEPIELSAFVVGLRSASAVGPVHDVTLLTFTTEPAPVGRIGDVAVLPGARALRLQVIVANGGNEPARRVPVDAIVTGPTGAVSTERAVVDLQPGARTTLTIGGLPLDGGGTSVLVVRIGPVEGETNVADNERTFAYTVR